LALQSGTKELLALPSSLSGWGPLAIEYITTHKAIFKTFNQAKSRNV